MFIMTVTPKAGAPWAFNPNHVASLQPEFIGNTGPWIGTRIHMIGGQSFLSDRSIEQLCEAMHAELRGDGA